MRIVRAIARFWYDFLIGDDWKIAAAVTVVLLAGAALLLTSVLTAPALPIVVAVALAAAFVAVVLFESRAD